MSKTIWIVVANRATARIFAAESPLGTISEVETLLHPEGRLPRQSLVGDRPGRLYDSTGMGRQEAGPDSVDQEHGAQLFAAQIAAKLSQAHGQSRFGTLVITAPPAFLGVLRKALDPQTQSLVTLELDKDLTHFDPRELRAHLPERFVRVES
jgi:protein required for attachment to host cells